jgi:hypothetical protein
MWHATDEGAWDVDLKRFPKGAGGDSPAEHAVPGTFAPPRSWGQADVRPDSG